MTSMLLGCIADDFTGASDLGNVLARAGMHTVQFNGIPKRLVPCQAGIVSLKSRSIPARDAVRQSLDALEWLKAQGAKQILFKYCSTFDSTPEGNIGPVAEAVMEALGAQGAIICPAYPTLGRSVYRGHLFVGDRLLNESGLEKHPLNPMTDPDLVRWLQRQTKEQVGRIDINTIKRGFEETRDAISRTIADGKRLVVCDCVADEDLVVLGAAVADMPLVTGGSGIAAGLPQNFRIKGELSKSPAAPPSTTGPALALAGSCSIATRRQIATHAARHPTRKVDVEEIMARSTHPDDVMSWIAAQSDVLPLIYSSDTPEQVRLAQERHGQELTARMVEDFFGAVATAATAKGYRRLIVAGGETSSAVVTALDVDAMEIGPEIDPGVPILNVPGPSRMTLTLKSGNFGADDFFAKALRAMDASSA